jgi:hypothetical protein
MAQLMYTQGLLVCSALTEDAGGRYIQCAVVAACHISAVLLAFLVRCSAVALFYVKCAPAQQPPACRKSV